MSIGTGSGSELTSPRNRKTALAAFVLLVLVWIVGTSNILAIRRDDAQGVEGGGGSRPSAIQSTVLTPDKSKQPTQAADDHKEPSSDDDFFASDGLQGAAPEPAFSDNVAVIMETDPSRVPNLVPLMQHFESVLGPKWPVVLLTLEANWEVPASPSFRRLLDAGRVRVMYLEANTTFPDHNSVSVFLTSEWFWAQFASAHRMLMFQTDSVLCANSPRSVDDFLAWDLVGAPIAPQFGRGYNGGLSLRNPRLMLQVARAHAAAGGGDAGFEDQWFYARLKEMPDAKLPSEDVAKTFAVETIYYETPLGYHQPERWQHDHMDQIRDWCPEVGMLMGRRF